MSLLPDADELRRLVEPALGAGGADGVEVVVAASNSGVTRFANSQIIQNTARREVRVYVRAALGSRAATAGTNQLDPAHLKRATEDAIEAAHATPPDPDFPGIVTAPEAGEPHPIMRFDDATASASSADRASEVATVLGVTGGVAAAGIYETSAHAYYVASTGGVDVYDAYTRCVVNCLADNGGATGWGEHTSYARGDVDVEAAARRALGKAEQGLRRGTVEPGDHDVVLEAPAVAGLLEYLSYMGFGAKQVIEGDSFLAHRAGEQVGAPGVTIVDDAGHPASIGIGFDLEGVTKMRVPVIEAGRAVGPVTDRRTAGKVSRAVTGHASGSNEFGPYASNVVMEPGDDDPGDLISGVEDGLLVTRFHYINVLDRPATLLTGMTRDGTFRIRSGEVAEAVDNFRFTQSVLDALARVQGIGSRLETIAPDYSFFGSTAAPALRVAGFSFASQTSH